MKHFQEMLTPLSANELQTINGGLSTSFETEAKVQSILGKIQAQAMADFGDSSSPVVQGMLNHFLYLQDNLRANLAIMVGTN